MRTKLLFLLVFFQLLSYFQVFASGETVNAALSDGPSTDPDKLGWVNVCDDVGFVVTFTVPANFNRPKQFDWYLNGTFVKTTTVTSTSIRISAYPATITCKVYYYNDATGTTSAAFDATGFTPHIKYPGLNDITQAGTLITGCNAPVSFSTSEITGNSFVYSPPPSDFTIKWVLPANWSFSGASTGNTITAVPDGVTSGNVSAYLQMNVCPFATTLKNFPVSFTGATQPPGILIPAGTTPCGSTADYSVQGVCGATSYTYTLSGAVFTSNGLTTLTTTATTVNVTFLNSGGDFIFTAAANFAGGLTSSSVSHTFTHGLPSLNVYIDHWVGDVFVAKANDYPGATYHWKVGSLTTGSTGPTCNGEPPCGVNTPVSVYAVGACGTTATSTITVKSSCTGGGPKKLNVSPNPSHGVMRVSLANESDQAVIAGQGKLVRAARIVDKAGRVMKRYAFGSGVPEASINTSGLATDVYILQIFDGTEWIHQQIIVK